MLRPSFTQIAHRHGQSAPIRVVRIRARYAKSCFADARMIFMASGSPLISAIR
jgi:hypothetical protein